VPVEKEVIDVLNGILETLKAQGKAQRSLVTAMECTHHAMVSILGLVSVRLDPEGRTQLERIRTALSLDNPNLWHDALTSVEEYLKRRSGD
jgi:hypothetical protein